MRFLIVGNIMSIKHQMQVFPLSQGSREKKRKITCFFVFLHVLSPDACWCLFWCFLGRNIFIMFHMLHMFHCCFLVVSLLLHLFSYLACLFHVLFFICFTFVVCSFIFSFENRCQSRPLTWPPLSFADTWATGRWISVSSLIPDSSVALGDMHTGCTSEK